MNHIEKITPKTHTFSMVVFNRGLSEFFGGLGFFRANPETRVYALREVILIGCNG